MSGKLGKGYRAGEVIVNQGDSGDCMYEILDGRVEVFQTAGGAETSLAVLAKGDFFGEMALFEKELRSASVMALTDVQALTIDKRTLLMRIAEDPSLAFRILEKMSFRIRELNRKLGTKNA